MGVKCLTQEHTTISRTARCRSERLNPWAEAVLPRADYLTSVLYKSYEHQNKRYRKTDKQKSKSLAPTTHKIENRLWHSERKNIYAAFCASLALIAGSGNNASCIGLQWLERVADCEKVREDVARLAFLHLSKHKFSFGISLLRKQASPWLLRGFLAYIFSGLLINKQYVKRVCG